MENEDEDGDGMMMKLEMMACDVFWGRVCVVDLWRDGGLGQDLEYFKMVDCPRNLAFLKDKLLDLHK